METNGGVRGLVAVAAMLAWSQAATANTITLTGTIRDFKGANEPGGHVDFESAITGLTPGLVSPSLGLDVKPVYVGPPGYGATHGAEFFNQWYRDVPGVNRSTLSNIVLNGTPGGLYTYRNEAFFPIDNQLFGNTPGQNHNFHFTYEIHTTFTYREGQTFTFIGDDDVWVFINSTLVIDIGGVHQTEQGSVNLDTLGLLPGSLNGFHLFYAERHTTASTFQIQTFIELNENPPPPPSVPEPGALGVLAVGLGGLVFWRALRARKHRLPSSR